VHGQIYDYMLRLKTFFGLRNVFGIVSTYKEWRFYWFPETDGAANTTDRTPYVQSDDDDASFLTSFMFEDEEESTFEEEMDEEPSLEADIADELDISVELPNARVVHGTHVIAWDHKHLVKGLISLLWKMHDSPYDDVTLIDNNRPYIVMTDEQWSWRKITWPKKFKLNYNRMPAKSTKYFILLKDYRGGVDGRVWLICTFSGSVGVIKFSQKAGNAERYLKAECNIWHTVWDNRPRVIKLANDWALLMPFVSTYEGKPVSKDKQRVVIGAIDTMAQKGMCHTDLKWRHVGLLSPTKAVLFDLARVRENVPQSEAREKMMLALNLSDIESDEGSDSDIDDDMIANLSGL